jgi:hypothetical protein
MAYARARRRVRRRQLLAVIAAAAGAALALPAAPAAAGPDASGRFGVEWEQASEVETVEDFCGIDGLTVETHWQNRFKGFFTYRGRDSIPYWTGSLNGSFTITEADGTTSQIVWNFIDKDQRIVDNGDGTLTITVQGAGGWKFIGPARTLRDPGMNRYQVLVDHAGTPLDPFDDPDAEFLAVIKESTGLNESGEGLCEDYSIVTGRTG